MNDRQHALEALLMGLDASAPCLLTSCGCCLEAASMKKKKCCKKYKKGKRCKKCPKG